MKSKIDALLQASTSSSAKHHFAPAVRMDGVVRDI
jgi:hypothetical protein